MNQSYKIEGCELIPTPSPVVCPPQIQHIVQPIAAPALNFLINVNPTLNLLAYNLFGSLS